MGTSVTRLLYLDDSYLRVFDSKVLDVQENRVILADTAFYPTGGGQPHDTGKLTSAIDGQVYSVLDVIKGDGGVVHVLDRGGLSVGDEVRGELDWTRRYRLMRMHTAAHLLSAVLFKETGALITGNQKGVDRSRIDFDLEAFEREKITEYVNKANELASQGVPVRTYYLRRDEAMQIPGVVKLAGALPPEVEVLRIVEIQGIDVQADAGTHVRNTSEIGKIEVVKMENRGRHNRRLYFTLSD